METLQPVIQKTLEKLSKKELSCLLKSQFSILSSENLKVSEEIYTKHMRSQSRNKPLLCFVLSLILSYRALSMQVTN